MSSQHYLVKIPALLLVMIGEYCAIWPPQNPPPDKVEGKAFGGRDFITRVARWGPQITVVRPSLPETVIRTHLMTAPGHPMGVSPR